MFENPYFKWSDGAFTAINQTLLPFREEYIKLVKIEDYFNAIRELKIRGAPAIGVAALFAIASSVKNINSLVKMKQTAQNNIEYLKTARPTAVNIFNALDSLKAKIEESSEENPVIFSNIIEQEAINLFNYEIETCEKMAESGKQLIKDGMNVLTHCNTGMLATPGIGTALGIIYTAFKSGLNLHVFVPETRPLLQGGRLTVFELEKAGIPYTLITDNMRGHLFYNRKIDIVFVGADRIALNGDTANKIGTFESAFLAHHHKIPFYVAAPVSTFDRKLNSGRDITIEERDSAEVTSVFGKVVSSAKNVYNPSFDITPADYITAVITEKGLIKPEVECIKALF